MGGTRRVDTEDRLPPRVLLVDDETVYCATMAKVLRARGLQVRTASSGAEALDVIAGEAIDVVVLDLKMPGLDGLATLRRLREVAPRVPVIILTGHGTVAAGLDAMADLAFDFLLKPASVDSLLKVILAAVEAMRAASFPAASHPKG